MEKEINYLSLPDYFNKFLFTNFNQKNNLKDSIVFQFRLSNKYHLGSAIKAIYLLEIIFPRKVSVLKLKLKKKKKIYFGQKSNNSIFYRFNITINSIDFINFYRFFLFSPFTSDSKKITNLFFVNRKLKQFDFDKSIFIYSNGNKFSLFELINYHLN